MSSLRSNYALYRDTMPLTSMACMLKLVWYMIAQTKYHVSENILLIIQHVEIFSSMTN